MAHGQIARCHPLRTTAHHRWDRVVAIEGALQNANLQVEVILEIHSLSIVIDRDHLPF